MMSQANDSFVPMCKVIVIASMMFLDVHAAEHTHAHDVVLDQAFRAFNEKHLGEAREYLAEFESEHSRSCESSLLGQFLALKYDVARAEVSAVSDPPPDKIEDYVAIYQSVRDRYLEEAADYRRSGDAETCAAEFATYQGLLWKHVSFLQALHAHQQAIEELYRAQAAFVDSENVLTRSTVVPVTDSQGRTANQEVPLFKQYGISGHESIALLIINASRQQWTYDHGDASRTQLIKAYDDYVSSYPTHPKAGLFLNYQMELEGKIDLDALVEIYNQCAFKDSSQYNGSILGLSHLLIDAGRPADALFFLRQIQEELIPGSRIAEMHYALGNVYEMQGDALNALKQYNAVTAMTSRYADVPQRIERILGVSSEAFDRIVLEAISEEGSGMKTHDAAIHGDESAPTGSRAAELRAGSGIELPDSQEETRAPIYIVGLAALATLALLCILVIRRNGCWKLIARNR